MLLSTVFDNTIFVKLPTVMVEESTSFAVLGSAWSPFAAVVDAVMVLPKVFAFTVAEIVKVLDEFLEIFPIVHKPVAWL